MDLSLSPGSFICLVSEYEKHGGYPGLEWTAQNEERLGVGEGG